jgi:hypothetical protein
MHKLEREKRRELVREKNPTTRRKYPQVEKEDTVASATMINGAMPSTLMG